jgi:hypothetical protein
MLRRGLALSVIAATLAAGAVTVSAQRGQRGMPAPYSPPLADAKYDGRFTFVRLSYTVGPGGFYYMGGVPSWAHGYAHAEENFLQILDTVSDINAHLNESKVINVGDPELFRYPVSYMTEAGYLTMNNDEAAAVRVYLQKGGFIIVDDFREDSRRGLSGWSNFAGVMERVWPGGKFLPVTGAHPIFHSFYDIDHPELFVTAYDNVTPEYYGLFENNDPTKRMLMMVNFMNDISEYWEFQKGGINWAANTNDAYKMGVNFFIYGITH